MFFFLFLAWLAQSPNESGAPAWQHLSPQKVERFDYCDSPEVSQAFGFGEIQFAVLEGAAGVFARLRYTDARLAEAGVNNRRDDSWAAVDVEFDNILAGEAVRARKPER